MEHQTVVGIKDATKERLSELRALSAVEKDHDMLRALAAEYNFLLPIRDEARRRVRVLAMLRNRTF